MAVFRVEKTKDYTIMSNHHLKDRRLSLKAKGLLSMMLSLPKEWDYTLKGLARISREGVDAIREAVRELEQAGYVVRSRTRNPKGQLANAEYVIYEHPMPASRSAPKPAREKPVLENPTQEKPAQEDPTQLKKQESNTNPEKTKPIASIHPILPKKRELDRCRARVEYQIEYDALLEDPRVSAAQLDVIVSLMTETLCSGKETISVGGEEHPAETVKEQLKRLTSEHIEYVLLCMRRTTGPIRNSRRYLLTAVQCTYDAGELQPGGSQPAASAACCELRAVAGLDGWIDGLSTERRNPCRKISTIGRWRWSSTPPK